MFFRHKPIVLQETIGEYLRKVRQAQSMSLFDISQEVGISVNYLQAIEQGQYLEIPGEVYLKNFIRLYGDYLNLNSQKLIKRYDKEKHILQNIMDHKGKRENSKRSLTEFLLSPKFIRISAVSLIFLFLFTYLGWELYSLFKPPKLQLISPAENLVTFTPVVAVEGSTLKEAVVTVNNQGVAVDAEGNFSEKIILKKGLNLIVVKARKERSKEAKIMRKVLVRQADSPTALQPYSLTASQSHTSAN